MGYSRYGSTGKGLSDRGLRSYNWKRRSKIKTGYDRYLFDKKTMLTPSGEYRGTYNIPGASGFEAYTSSGKKRIESFGQIASGIPIRLGDTPKIQGAMGGMSTGYGGRTGLPGKIQRMLMQEGSAIGGEETQTGKGLGMLVGVSAVGWLVWKMLI